MVGVSVPLCLGATGARSVAPARLAGLRLWPRRAVRAHASGLPWLRAAHLLRAAADILSRPQATADG